MLANATSYYREITVLGTELQRNGGEFAASQGPWFFTEKNSPILN